MKYVSTRGTAPVLEFADVLLEGLARDGGLYVPETLPSLAQVRDTDYPQLAAAVMAPYVGDFPGFATLVGDAYATFDHPSVVPLVELGDGVWVQELFHGPTLAFKDVALQLVGRLMDAELARRGDRRTIVVATSGDTGSAAIAACVGRPTLDIIVLHPAGRVSDVQRRQMTTIDEPNVHNVAIEGTFDDCQDLVKAMFADNALRDEVRLGAMNSINWGRVLAQIPYYVDVAERVGPCDVVVPSGNFGNMLAGWYSKHMGAAIERLVIASNRNDILARWVARGELVTEEVVPTLSPAMDIQVSSNHERLLFELLDRNGAATAELLTRFRAVGSVEAPTSAEFLAARCDDDETLEEIARRHREQGYIADPHTAVGLRAARSLGLGRERPVVCLATASPAKFPEAVEQAIGFRPPLPEHLRDLLERPEHYEVLPNDLAAGVVVCQTVGSVKYVVCVPDGCADAPIAALGGRTPLEVASMPTLAALASRAEVGRAAVIPPGLPPGSDVGNMAIFGYDPTRYHTGRAPIEAAALGLKLRPDQVAYRCNLVTVDVDGVMVDFAGGHPSSEDAAKVIAALDAELGGTVAFHNGVQYRHIVVAPGEWSDAECTPPHDLTDKPAIWPTGAAAPQLQALMDASREIVPRFGLKANQIWLWGQGFQPQMPAFRDAYGLDAGLVTAVDLVRGLGVLTDMNIVEVPGATGWYDTDYEGKRDAALRTLESGADLFLIHVEATDEAGHAGNLEEKINALEAWDLRILTGLVAGLDAMGPWRMLLLPDHPTPIELKTHTSDSVPYMLVDSATDGPGGSYTEAATADCAAVPGHELMGRLVSRG